MEPSYLTTYKLGWRPAVLIHLVINFADNQKEQKNGLQEHPHPQYVGIKVKGKTFIITFTQNYQAGDLSRLILNPLHQLSQSPANFVDTM